MYSFNYHRPDSIEDASGLFEQADDGTFIAGGQTLLPTMKQRLAAPTDLIDLSAIIGLNGIALQDRTVRIGAMTTHAEVASSAPVRQSIAALAILADGIGDPQVRNRGTIGGSVANADPAADYPAAVLALNATLVSNRRSIAADDFFTGLFETALDEGELLTRIDFPIPQRAAYVKFPQPASRYALVGVFISVTGGDVRVAVTGAGPSVFRCSDMETALSGDLSANAISDIRVDSADLNSDLHASSDYRAHLIGVLARRAVAQLSAG